MAGRAPQPERLKLPFEPLESETREGLGWNEVGQFRNLLSLHNIVRFDCSVLAYCSESPCSVHRSCAWLCNREQTAALKICLAWKWF
eukprot:90778-Heterocapsa_arctica.AAC.1